MQVSIEIFLLALIWLLFKHMIADYFLQKPYQFLNKGTYGHMGGFLHAAIHVLCTLPVFLIAPMPSALIFCLILAGEFILHYHIDWGKEQVTRKFGWTPADQGFWSALGVDQFLHGLTYILMLKLLFT